MISAKESVHILSCKNPEIFGVEKKNMTKNKTVIFINK